jgi:zinc protease
MELLRRGAGSRDAQTFAEDLERRGLSIETGVAHDGASIVLSGNVEQLAFGLDLVADMVLRPKLSGSELKQVKELSIAGLQQALSEPSWVASRTANALYWGAGHPYGRPVDGTQAGIAKAGVGDVKKWLKQAWVSGGASITASGAVDLATLQPMLEARLGAPWKAKSATALTLPGLTAHRAEPIFIVDAPGSAQTGFYLAFPGLKSGDAKLAAAQVGTIALGGTFTSRLNALLREKKGYTYGVKAAVEPLRHDGTFVVRTRIRTDVTAPALVDLLGELEGIRQGINEEELTKAKGAYRQDIVAAMESVGGAAGVFSDIHEAGLAPETLRTELEKTGRLRVASIKPAMMAYDIAGGVVVLVGDQKVIEPELRKAGFTLIKTVTPP